MEADLYVVSLLKTKQAAKRAWVVKLNDFLMRNHNNSSLKINSFATSVFMSERTLRRKCNELFGFNPSELLIRYRVHRAKLLLRTEKMIGDISSEVGFTTHAHFSTQFRKYEGLSPQKFRENLKGCPNNENSI